MTDPKNISILDYSYQLPDDKIAHFPLTNRDDSKLLIYKQGAIAEDCYKNIATHLPEKSLLLFNNTKVISARLIFQKPTGGIIEIFCLEPDVQYADIATAMLQKSKVHWQCLIGGASKWKPGQLLEKKINYSGKEIILSAKFISKQTGFFIVELFWNDTGISFAELLHFAGAIPLPPYIKREAIATDKERYQTIYAESDGSVAAPTAGLHFTENIFQSLRNKNIQRDFVTLHVGAGTFKPVYAPVMFEHEMHAEWIDVSKIFIENILNNLAENIIAVGTTTLRTIESLYWLGVKSMSKIEWPLALNQWEAYELEQHGSSPEKALQALLHWMQKNKIERLITKTQILIAPGYRFKIINGLITNFHQPQSTLLLLVAALMGDNWRKVYDYALKNNFRFLSYGDGSLLWADEKLL